MPELEPVAAPPQAQQQRRPRSRRLGTWIHAEGQNIFYRPRAEIPKPSASTTPSLFPAPLIGPRRSRPHAIHIITYPPGYVPKDLRKQKPVKPVKPVKRKETKSRRRGRVDKRRAAGAPQTEPSSIRPALGKLLSSISASLVQKQQQIRQQSPSRASPAVAAPSPFAATGPIADLAPEPAGVPTPTQILPEADDVISRANTHSLVPDPHLHLHLHNDDHPAQSSQRQRRRHTLQTLLSQPPALPQEVSEPQRPQLLQHSLSLPQPQPQPQQQRHRQHDDSTLARLEGHAASPNPAMAARIVPPPSAYNFAGGPNNRSSLLTVRNAKSTMSSLVTEVPKPVASGSGVTCSIILAEPNIFLSGFDHDGHARREDRSGTALLRGKLQLNVSKNVKIKAIQLKLHGRARTEWPEGIPPLKQEVFEEESLRTQVLTFFNAMNEGWESDYGNQCVYNLKNSSANSSSTNLPASRSVLAVPQGGGGLNPRNNLSAKELKRLSLQNVQQRSFNKDSPVATPTQAKGFKIFYPGTYDYNFELPIDHHQLETTKLQYGSVKWELHATIDRAGAFKPNLHGVKEVSIVRLPDQLSLEMSEPISISRRWEDQLHYDIIISGKSFPVGSKIPIAFKLTPLAKVQVHKLKVFVTESIEYWTNDKRVTRKDPGRKILLLEKSAGKPLDPAWASSDMRTIRGGELTPQQRREARETAARRRQMEAARRQGVPEPLPEPTENLLGDLDLGLENILGSTEIEANVQMPTCEMMAKNKDLRLNPDCSWKNVNVYHWIKIVMRISRLDPEDPSGTKRRHFEISIDSPFTVLNCRATQANTNLPAYANPVSQPDHYQSVCGCGDSASIATGPSQNSSTGTLPGIDMSTDNLPAPPQAAHLSTTAMNPASSPQNAPAPDPLGIQNAPRPMHLMRAPSFNPPGFDEDSAPPPHVELVDNPDAAEAPFTTPPPQYDIVVGTPSVDGMAGYFARLAEHGLDGDDSGSDSDSSPPRILERSGRVNVSHPRTPGGRMPSRSFEFARPSIDLNLASLPTRGNAAEAAV